MEKKVLGLGLGLKFNAHTHFYERQEWLGHQKITLKARKKQGREA
jgi:hypothetical protein